MAGVAQRPRDVSSAHPSSNGRAYGSGRERVVVTIDGPAASGKSSVARGVAESLGVPFVSSGLLYRAATHLSLQNGRIEDDESAVMAVLQRLEVLLTAVLNGPNRVSVDGVDVTPRLHTDAVDMHVSAVARHPRVRRWVYERLREVEGSFVIEGRDMGTVVFPEAPHKFYLTAPAKVRAARRVGERAAGLTEVTDALERRDRLDAVQLAPAPDAVRIDTASLDVEGVVARVLEHVRAST